MESDHKDMVQKNYMLFTELLRLNSVPVIKYLYDEQILEEDAAEKVMSQAANTLKSMHLLDNLLKLGPAAFNSLYAATLYAKVWRVADLMEPDKRPHEARENEPKVPLPDVWPSKVHLEELQSKEFKIQLVESNDTRMKDWYDNSKKNNIYDMNQTVKGRALIINNFKFTKLPERDGTDRDKEGLNIVLTQLGFDVDTKDDQTKQQMEDLLQRECRQRDHSEYNCFFLVILSHGNKGVVYGTDGYEDFEGCHNCLSIEDIKAQFYNVKSLERKPKVFIIQACQGSDRNRRIDKKVSEDVDEDIAPIIDDDDDDDDDHVDDKDAEKAEKKSPGTGSDGTTMDGGGEEQDEGENSDGANERGDRAEGGGDDEDDANQDEEETEHKPPPYINESLTEEQPFHFLVALATTDGSVAYRDTVYGSWFIQAFLFVLVNYAHKEDLLTLMEKVNSLVRKALFVKDEKKKKRTLYYNTVSHIMPTFIKKFYFFPGMPLQSPGKAKK